MVIASSMPFPSKHLLASYFLFGCSETQDMLKMCDFVLGGKRLRSTGSLFQSLLVLRLLALNNRSVYVFCLF